MKQYEVRYEAAFRYIEEYFTTRSEALKRAEVLRRNGFDAEVWVTYR